MKTKLCKQCNKEFIQDRPLVPYCSYACKLKHDIIKEKEKKKIAREKKKVSVSVLSKKLDIIFSKYIRARDSKRTTGTFDKCECITCWEVVDNIQCGHFVSRSSRATRWDWMNCAWQCPKCNCWGSGRQYEFGKRIDEMYGVWVADELILKWKTVFKLTTEFLLSEIEHYEKLYNLCVQDYETEKDL